MTDPYLRSFLRLQEAEKESLVLDIKITNISAEISIKIKVR